MRARSRLLAAYLVATASLPGRLIKKPPTVPQIVQQSLLPTTEICDLARADLESAQAGLQQATAAHQEALRALEVLMGRYPAAERRSAEGFPKLPPLVPDGLPSELLARHPDLIAAERRVAASFHLMQSAKAPGRIGS